MGDFFKVIGVLLLIATIIFLIAVGPLGWIILFFVMCVWSLADTQMDIKKIAKNTDPKRK